MMMRVTRNGEGTPALSDVSREAGGCASRKQVRGGMGYTLLQLLITLAVILVLAALALPTTGNALRNYRLNAAVSAASGAIMAARYQAIMHAYPYNVTFDSTHVTYQLASEPQGSSSFTPVASAVPISGVGDVTINQTTTLQFNANGTVLATAGTLSFTISNGILTKTITVTGVGDVSVN
jgi:Tfp pilus assembly protein FimT